LPGEIERLHATAIAVGNRAALIRGPSGAGKSDLALRCLATAPSSILPIPARLVADDQVVLTRATEGLTVEAPPILRGKLEVRGLGILEVDAIPQAEVVLVVDLFHNGQFERFPDPWPTVAIAGLSIPLLSLDPFQASAPLKLLAALSYPLFPR
jgi:serine kinase of HPr protein (carbohydrate metabolism regulator)